MTNEENKIKEDSDRYSIQKNNVVDMLLSKKADSNFRF